MKEVNLSFLAGELE